MIKINKRDGETMDSNVKGKLENIPLNNNLDSRVQNMQKMYSQSIIDSSNKTADLLDKVQKINQDKARRVKETYDNIERIASSSSETNELLREQNEILKENNQLLSEKLQGMSRTLDNLFNLTEVNSDEQTKLLEEANEIAKRIEISIIQNGKFDIKEFAANTSTTLLFTGLQVFLHNKGLL